MAHDVVSTDNAPRAIGPYAQAAVARGSKMIFCSGQIPLDPHSGHMVGAGNLRAETTQVMHNLAAVLAAAGASLADVVRTTIFLTDLQHFATVNEVYGSFFSGPHPARATVQVVALPRGAQVEIDAIAVLA
jgi:2-iminobutanoate/2-iminopropanoate deaminase